MILNKQNYFVNIKFKQKHHITIRLTTVVESQAIIFNNNKNAWNPLLSKDTLRTNKQMNTRQRDNVINFKVTFYRNIKALPHRGDPWIEDSHFQHEHAWQELVYMSQWPWHLHHSEKKSKQNNLCPPNLIPSTTYKW